MNGADSPVLDDVRLHVVLAPVGSGLSPHPAAVVEGLVAAQTPGHPSLLSELRTFQEDVVWMRDVG